MTPPSIVVILGNRPQFIKHAALQRAWAAHADELRPIVVDTGQHYDYELAGVFRDELKLPVPDYSLGVGSASHGEQLARMLPPIEELLLREKPSALLVYGDTNSTLGGALAASKLNVPIAHVEAGLRSYDRTMPEEINRVVTDHVSQLLFCPTETAVANLRLEGITTGVDLVGDVMTDIATLLAPAADERWPALAARLGLDDGGFGVVTVHRASNTEPDALRALIEGFRRSPLPLIFPMHPRTTAAFERAGLHVELTDLPNMVPLPAFGYIDLAAVVRHSRCVLTDSGGLQKEAYIHGVPCITLRDTSEWVETIDTGMNVLVHNDPDRMEAALMQTLAAPPHAHRDNGLPPVYGRGDASERIVAALVQHAAESRLRDPGRLK